LAGRGRENSVRKSEESEESSEPSSNLSLFSSFSPLIPATARNYPLPAIPSTIYLKKKYTVLGIA